MTRTAVLMACIVAGVAGAAQAATVEFQIVERRGQVAWTGQAAQPAGTNDNILNFSVQARVVGSTTGEALGNFGFDIVSNEAQTNGTLARGVISLGTGQPDTANYANSSAVGTGGLARTYSYLAGINGQFNGLINVSGGSFTQNPAVNDIGLVIGSPTGGALLNAFGSAGRTDANGDPAPDTFPDGSSGSTASLDPTLAQQLLGAGGNFVSVYNFNYTMSSNAIRVVTFSLANIQAQTFTSLALANTVWGPDSPQNAQTIGGSVSVAVTPAPGAAALLGLGGLMAGRRRRN